MPVGEGVVFRSITEFYKFNIKIIFKSNIDNNIVNNYYNSLDKPFKKRNYIKRGCAYPFGCGWIVGVGGLRQGEIVSNKKKEREKERKKERA